MNKDDLKNRTKDFCVRVIKMTNQLPETRAANNISSQLTRSAMSIGANYRAARLAKSHRDFINKLKIVEEETDESLYWLELIEDCNLLKSERLKSLKQEATELLAIFISSLKTAKNKVQSTKYN